jgi:hypothetical protein
MAYSCKGKKSAKMRPPKKLSKAEILRAERRKKK